MSPEKPFDESEVIQREMEAIKVGEYRFIEIRRQQEAAQLGAIAVNSAPEDAFPSTRKWYAIRDPYMA